MIDSTKQLNAFEIKREITRIIKALEKSNILVDTREFQTLDEQQDKNLLIKILLKEFALCNEDNMPVIKLLILRYLEEEQLIKEMETIIKTPTNDNNIKLHAIEVISEIKKDWHEQGYDTYLEYNEELVQKETKELLESSQDNTEIQLDFLDFFSAIPPKDQIMLLDSLEEDQQASDLANILIPLFLSFPEDEIGTRALKMLGSTRSDYAYKALEQAATFFSLRTQQAIKKCLNELKLSGVNPNDSTRQIDLKNSTFYIIPPDGEGNISLIYTENLTNDEAQNIRVVGIVIDDYSGVRECLGFSSISDFEATFLMEKLTGSDFKTKIQPEMFKSLLIKAEKLNYKKAAPPYEYNCWKKLFLDIEQSKENIDDFLEKNIQPKNITKDELNNFLNSDFTVPWFYSHNFGDETEVFFKELDNQLRTQNIEELDLDKLVEKGITTIFYDEEKTNWINRLKMSAYCKVLGKENETAQIIYSMTTNESALQLLYTLVIKQSIFQYFLTMSLEENFLKYKQPDIENIISYLEKIWGFYV